MDGLTIEKKVYPDGSFYPVINGLNNFTGSGHNFFTCRINSYEDLWFLRQVKDVFDHNNIKANLFIPCLLDAQADRRFKHNQSHNLKLVCQFINDMK